MKKYTIGFLATILTLNVPVIAEPTSPISGEKANPLPSQNRTKGFMIALSAPSGTGKSTIAHKLLELDPNIMMSISVTTRPMRSGEVEGRDYFFVSPEEFKRMDKNNELAEKSENYGNLYGISQKFIQAKVSSGKDILLDLNWDGVKQLDDQKDSYDMVKIFILPPSLKELEKRLRSRATDKEDAIVTRLAHAKKEINHHTHYDYIVVNHDIDQATSQVKSIIEAERLKRTRQSIPSYDE